MQTLPAEKSLHTKTIKEIVDKQKRFSTKQGDRDKYIVEFTDGYKAEYCPLVGTPWKYKKGDEASFKIAFRKEFGDEIDFIDFMGNGNGNGNHVGNVTNMVQTKPDDTTLTPFNMHGHPASLALMAAKDIHVAALNRLDAHTVKTMLKEADEIFNWLVAKANS